MKTILVVLLEKYADWEAAYITSGLAQLAKSEYRIKTVSLTTAPVHSFGGLGVQADCNLSNIPDEYEGIVLIGGYTWRDDASRMLEPLIRKCAQEKN